MRFLLWAGCEAPPPDLRFAVRIHLAHLNVQGVDVAVFDADATTRLASDPAELLAQLTAKAKATNLRVQKPALAFVEARRLTYYGTPDLVKYLVANVSRDGTTRSTYAEAGSTQIPSLHATDDPRVVRFRDGFWFSRAMLERLAADKTAIGVRDGERLDVLARRGSVAGLKGLQVARLRRAGLTGSSVLRIVHRRAQDGYAPRPEPTHAAERPCAEPRDQLRAFPDRAGIGSGTGSSA